jgi:hypothetical protein
MNLSERDKQENSQNCIMRLFILCRILFNKCSISTLIKSGRMKTGHIARTEEMRNPYRILVTKPERKTPLGDIGIDGCIILKTMLK